MTRFTPLGWTCIGPTGEGQNYEQTNFARTYFCTGEIQMSEVNAMLHRFWEMDSCGVVNFPVRKEGRVVLNKAQGSIQFADGRYKIATPLKDTAVVLPINYLMAFNRLNNLEKQLQRSSEIAMEYQATINRHLEKGYIRQVECPEKQGAMLYLPHFAVVKQDRSTTKVRIVFNAAAKYHGVSLNDVVFQGPKLQRDLFDMLLRFRRYPIAVMCDISEMHLRIELIAEDIPYHRFLWRDMKVDQKPSVYEFNQLVFGVNSLPFLAQLVSQHHARLHEKFYPRAAETISYMDDNMDSVMNDDDGIELYEQLSELWEKAEMFTHKWLSNSPAVLNKIPVKDRIQEVDLDKGVLPSVSFQTQKMVQSVSLHTLILLMHRKMLMVLLCISEWYVKMEKIFCIVAPKPLQTISIPRLELMGASLDNKLAHAVSF